MGIFRKVAENIWPKSDFLGSNKNVFGKTKFFVDQKQFEVKTFFRDLYYFGIKIKNQRQVNSLKPFFFFCLYLNLATRVEELSTVSN